jgi:hypothetical protein
MNSMDRFDQAAAEDAQASKVLNWQEATILNLADNIIRQIEEMRTFNSDTYLDGCMKDAVLALRSLQENIEG